jgi:pimeloyl-ACP methyl ester carboxylesterase
VTKRLQFVGLLWLLVVTACRQEVTVYETNTWVDRSPHKDGFVQVNGIKIEYLDWGGTGEPMVFLAGLGATAHIYDELAPKFTDTHWVVALTRRGTGDSDKPNGGYDLATLVSDVRAALDALSIKRAVVVGHSFGCQEAAQLASEFPERISKVIYVDGAYQFTPRIIALNEQLESFREQPGPADGASIESLMCWYAKHKSGWTDVCETDFRATRKRLGSRISLDTSTQDLVFKAAMDDVMESPPNFANVRVPTLAIFADHQLDSYLASLNQAARANAEPLVAEFARLQREEVERFRATVKNATVVELRDTDHMCITQRSEAVEREKRTFLATDLSAE